MTTDYFWRCQTMAIAKDALSPHTTLVARYKGQPHSCQVIEQEGALRFALPDGRTFRSPSGAARAIVGGSVNGWRFWSLPDTNGQPQDRPQPKARASRSRAGKKLVLQIKKLPARRDTPEGEARWWCSACMAAFTSTSQERPQACPQGHPASVTDDLT
jgi:hypothetical protein